MSEQHDYDGIKYREEKKSPALFRGFFTILIVWAVAFMGYYLFGGWSSQTEADMAKAARDGKSQIAHKAVEANANSKKDGAGHKVEEYIAAGKQLYGSLCASCHGENAKGVVGPDLTISKYKYGKSRLDIAKTISDGRPDGMPGFGVQISHEQVESLVEYVMSLK